MQALQKLASRLRALFRKRRLDAEMDEEMRAHLEMRAQANIADGMEPDEARRAAAQEFGWSESVKETCREQRGVSWLENLGRDLGYGARILGKNRGFALVAILTLALGIGANTAIFSFVNAILIRPLPFRDPSRLVILFESWPAQASYKNACGPILDEWRRQNTSFEGLTAVYRDGYTLTGRGTPETIGAPSVSANTFSLLGVKPILGRDFLPEEETFGKNHVVLLSYEFWQNHFGGDANVVGQSIDLNHSPYLVVGVMPPHTFFPDSACPIWTALAFSPETLRMRHAHNYTVFGRLKPNVTLEQARADMDLVAARMAAADAKEFKWGAEVYPWRDIMVGGSRTELLALLGAVAMVLLIACVNIANLLLARSATRSHEFSIRTALGAGRSTILRQLLTESLLLSLCGGVAGLAAAKLGLGALTRLAASQFPRLWEGVHLDAMTLAFAAIVTLATAILFGLAPAWQTARRAVASGLNEGPRGGSGGLGRQWTRSVLVISEVALSLILLASAGLMIRSFAQLMSQQLGYDTERLITMTTGLPDQQYPSLAERSRLLSQLLEKVRILPGVQSAAVAFGVPLTGMSANLSVNVVGAAPHRPGDSVAAGYEQVSAGYFETMKIPFAQGRDFTDHDDAHAPPVLIVDETFTKNFNLGSGADVIGKRINVGDGTDNAEIIGVVKDTKHDGMAAAPRGEMYRPLRQACHNYVGLVVRTQTDTAAMIREIRGELDSLDKDLPLQNIRTMTQLVSDSVGSQRLSMQLLGTLAGIALLLAVIGLYGVLSYNVTDQTREIGIRMALGAPRVEVLKLILKRGMGLTLAGLIVGLAGALAVTRELRAMLFGVSPNDLLTFVAVSLVLTLAGLAACWIPALRAARLEPMAALRHE
jgi:putative ABC transport system permease protein